MHKLEQDHVLCGYTWQLLIIGISKYPYAHDDTTPNQQLPIYYNKGRTRQQPTL
jgi:hypothetical protein